MDYRLAAHSCGGSAGIDRGLTGFPLSFAQSEDRAENHDGVNMTRQPPESIII